MRRHPRMPVEELAPYLLVEGGGGRAGSVSDGHSVADASGSPLDWREVFGNGNPVQLEIGFGKGLFLVTMALAHPEINFVGVEIVRKYQLFTATRLAKRNLRNVRVACADARLFLPRFVAAESLQAVHVYFPDPWWKKRHHKRRVFTAEFVAECLRVLRRGGKLNAVTDVEEYAGVMAALLAEQAALQPLPPPHEQEPTNDLDYLTNFERKFRKQGKAIYRLHYEKRYD
ncbi:MAG: tRNA (guanosine(46)-N7)-methyltransferase TrmB [Gemmataceae bacterium]